MKRCHPIEWCQNSQSNTCKSVKRSNLHRAQSVQASDHTYFEFVRFLANKTQSINVNCINIQALLAQFTH